jgi:hypothetical protein
MSKITVLPPRSPSPWPSAKIVKQFADKLDELAECWQEMQGASKLLRKKPRDADALMEPKWALDAYKENSDLREGLANGDFQRLRSECCPGDWRDENNEVRKSEVIKMVAKLVGSFLMNVPDPELFVPQMVEDIHSWDPS